MTPITAIRAALVAAIAPTLPHGMTATARPAGAEYDPHPLRAAQVMITVTVTTPGTGPAIEADLDALMDPAGGARAALEHDRTLGGLVGYLHVAKCSGYHDAQDQDGQLVLAVTWLVACACLP